MRRRAARNGIAVRDDSDRARPCATWTLVACGLAVLGTLGGCGPRETRFRIIDYRTDDAPAAYYETFDECYYSLDALGNVEVVARRTSEPAPDNNPAVTQVVHIRGIWRAIPGSTYVESTQINAQVSYWILSGRNGVGLEGAGFATFSEDRRRATLVGKLELSSLQPKRQFGSAPELFEKTEVTGQFRATRDRRRVVRILNEMERQFGPLPRHDTPPAPL